jgi:hypothetical protein
MALLGARHSRSRLPLAMGLLASVLALVLQNVFDWSFTIPALAALWAFAIGHCAGLGAHRGLVRPSIPTRPLV